MNFLHFTEFYKVKCNKYCKKYIINNVYLLFNSYFVTECKQSSQNCFKIKLCKSSLEFHKNLNC